MLANPGNLPHETIIEQILHNIIQAHHLHPEQKNKYITHLEILALLRNMQPLVIQKLYTMSLEIDIQKDLRFQQGRIQGREEGLQQGLQQGREEGALQEKINIAKKLLAQGFDIHFISQTTELPVEQIQSLLKS
ncbi:MAG: hypothetical protein NZ576_11960 [Bacteroidia bacterium]|nr:hypothetical protein [Bacteroidia bacterium]